MEIDFPAVGSIKICMHRKKMLGKKGVKYTQFYLKSRHFAKINTNFCFAYLRASEIY